MSAPTEEAVVSAVYDNNTAALQRLLQAGADPNAQDENGLSAATIAACSNQIHMLRILIEAGADLNARDKDGNTTVLLTTFGILPISLEDKITILQFLLNAGADPNIPRKDGRTPLFYAINPERSSEELLQCLIQAGANLNAKKQDGTTSLMAVASEGHTQFLRILIQAGADSDTQDAQGCTAIDHAIIKNQMDTLRILLEAGADPNVGNGAGFTALIAAAANNQIDALRILLEAGADPNVQHGTGFTALIAAALENHIEAVRVLLDAGAIPTPEEMSVLVKNTNNLEIRQLIREALQNSLDVILEEMRANAAVRSPRELMSSDTTDNPEIVQLPTFAEQQQEPTGNSMSRTEMYDFLLRRDGAKCQGCGRAFDDPRYLEIDHIMPRSDGGSDHISNRVLLCGPCNRAKGNQYTLSGLRRLNKKNGWMVKN